ncbi:VanZ family protein [Planococcus sp. NCCP-2050]|uniref:VanZ family protein n=1 Tax=Planococcus sp. NCCP-2050 TaxID=2944679 RepID=UPI00203FB6D1|nr:VanZ family protein [Planococcus sp. NCCP-2050]GKW46311.1 hypothetical protein NCCP2050_20030 [Planococcus sp. NCCP-2050]
MSTKQRKIIWSILFIYSILIVYFMFFGFGRPTAAGGANEYQFNLIPHTLALKFPNMSDLKYFHLWFFNIGNLAAFIPFGILIPLLQRWKFLKFIFLFFIGILALETIQMLTFLGSFDIDDALVNTVGATIGFYAYRLGSHYTNRAKRASVTCISIIILSIAVIGFSELLNKMVTPVEGPEIALNEVGEMPGGPYQSFKVGPVKVEPTKNLYKGNGQGTTEFSYKLDGKDIVLSLNYGIPANAKSDKGQIRISVDGKEVDSYSVDKGMNYPNASETAMEKVNELIITIEGEVMLWDVAFKEIGYWWNY